MEARRKQHQRNRKASYDRSRPNSAKRLYNTEWKKQRTAFLIENPFCAECRKSNQLVAAIVVDHRVPHRGNTELFWDKTNWQSLCKHHHDRKTATYDSKFAPRK